MLHRFKMKGFNVESHTEVLQNKEFINVVSAHRQNLSGQNPSEHKDLYTYQPETFRRKKSSQKRPCPPGKNIVAILSYCEH
jgi:hypothetical protein